MDGSNFMMRRPKTMDRYDIYNLLGSEQSRSIEGSETMEEFNEEDIWGGAPDAETKREGFQDNGCSGLEENIVGKEGIRQSPKSHEGNNKRIKQCSSGPVNIPYLGERKDIGNFCKKTHGMICDHGNSSDVDNRDFERNMIPPHEFIAMPLARKEITSLSEFEGVGKTLKCRDAIWTLTCFIA